MQRRSQTQQLEEALGPPVTTSTKILLFSLFAYALSVLLLSAEGIVGGIATAVFFIGWLAAPIAMWYDTKTIARHTDWNPHSVLWSIGAFIPSIIGLGIIAFYLDKRRKQAARHRHPPSSQ